MKNNYLKYIYLIPLICLVSFSICWAKEESKNKSDEQFLNSIAIQCRYLEGEELILYKKIKAEIQRLSAQTQATNLKEEIIKLLKTIDTLPESVGFYTRDSLRSDLAKSIWESVEPDLSIVLSLLEESHYSIRTLALDILNSAPYKDRLVNQKIIQKLKDFLFSDDTETDLRLDIMGTFFGAGEFDEIRAFSEKLVAEHKDEELVRGAASLLCSNVPWEKFNTKYVIKQFREGNPILRQEAALALSRLLKSDLPKDIEIKVIDEIVLMMKDSALTPYERGEAIEASSRWVDEEKVYKTLIGLLESDQWFFGSTGQHGPVHSLVKINDTLFLSKRSETLDFLIGVLDSLHELPIELRSEVESDIRSTIERFKKREK